MQTLESDGGTPATLSGYDGDNLTSQAVLALTVSGSVTTSSTVDWSSFGYNADEQQTLEVDGGKVTTSDGYDGDNLTLEAVLDSASHTISWSSYGYNSAGLQTLRADLVGQTTLTRYDGDLATLMATVNSASATVEWESFGFDAAGRNTLIVDGDGNPTDYRYDGDDLTATVSYSGSVAAGSVSAGYDQAGEMTLRVDGDGHTIRYAYAGGLLTEETWYGSNGTASNTLGFGYDQAGELTLAWNGAGSYAFGYDAGYLTRQVDPNSLTVIRRGPEFFLIRRPPAEFRSDPPGRAAEVAPGCKWAWRGRRNVRLESVPRLPGDDRGKVRGQVEAFRH